MLYIFDKINELTDDFVEQSIPYLSVQRLEKVLSYRFLLDRKLSVAAYMLLRLSLKESFCIDEPVVFSYGKNGKPFLRDYPCIYFNLSHCKNAVACVVSYSEIGVDIEEITPVSDDLAKRVLTAYEFEAYKTSENPSLQFFKYWVIKESYLKKTGQGICVDLTALSSDDIGEKILINSNKAVPEMPNDYCCCMTGVITPTIKMISSLTFIDRMFQLKRN